VSVVLSAQTTDKLVNEVKVNASWNAQRIPPVGDTWQRATYGYQFPELFSPTRKDTSAIGMYVF